MDPCYRRQPCITEGFQVTEAEKQKQENFADDILRLTPSMELIKSADLLQYQAGIIKNLEGENRHFKTESQV